MLIWILWAIDRWFFTVMVAWAVIAFIEDVAWPISHPWHMALIGAFGVVGFYIQQDRE